VLKSFIRYCEFDPANNKERALRKWGLI
jgi:hypothetical protein